MRDDDWHKPNRLPPPPRQPKAGELLFEFYVERTKTLYPCELFDRGQYGFEAQFFDPVDLRIARTFRADMDPERTPREMAIAWAEEERKAIEADPADEA